jgi:DNA-binding CsgD family transcriptional regulator
MGNVLRAQKLYEEALILHRETARLNNPHVPYILAGLASIASTRGQFERAAKLLAAAGNSSHLIRFANLGTFKNITFYNDVAMVRAQLGETAFAEAWIAGKAMPLEQGIIYALEGRTMPMDMNSIEHAASSATASPASQPPPESLNARELEVLSFIASGLSNREIAAKMFLSVNTVKWYLKGIFGKLQVANRAQAVIRAQALGLLSQE